MLFSLLKHYLDTALKVSQSVYCFITYLMVLKTIFQGCGVRASLMLFLSVRQNFHFQTLTQKRFVQSNSNLTGK